MVRRRTAERLCQLRVDQYLEIRANQATLIWVPEPESKATAAVTYREWRVNEFAALLTGFAGVHTGDRVTFHLPMVPEPIPPSAGRQVRTRRNPD